jgi:hypothetical protein
VALVQPRAGLLAVSVVVSLGYSQPVWPFFAGWLIPARADRRGPRVPGAAAWIIAAIAGASAGVGVWKPEWIGMRAAAAVLEGLGLMAATVTLFRWHPRLARDLPLAMVLSTLAGASASVLLTRIVGVGQLAAMACVAIGMAASTTKRPGDWRLLWIAAATASVVALLPATLSVDEILVLAHAWTVRCAGAATALLTLSSVAMAGLVMLRWSSALARSPRDFRLLWCGLGVAVTMAAWLAAPCGALSAHAFPEWILIGLVAGLSGSALIETTALPPTTARAAGGLRV